MRKLILLLLPILVVACATLTPAGKKVKYITKQEAPEDCEQMEETIESSYNMSQKNMITNMRNEVGEKGGNFLVVDTIAAVSNEGSVSYNGTGRGFNCP